MSIKIFSFFNLPMGVRESRRIIGKQMIREEAALNGVVPEDTIALGSYIIDIHSGTGERCSQSFF